MNPLGALAFLYSHIFGWLFVSPLPKIIPFHEKFLVATFGLGEEREMTRLEIFCKSFALTEGGSAMLKEHQPQDAACNEYLEKGTPILEPVNPLSIDSEPLIVEAEHTVAKRIAREEQSLTWQSDTPKSLKREKELFLVFEKAR